MLSDCRGRGLRPDPPSPTSVNLLPAFSLGGAAAIENTKKESIQEDREKQGIFHKNVPCVFEILLY